MNQSVRIALRNVGRQKKRSLLLGGAVAFGFLVISLVNGFTGGILLTVKENFSYAFGGHLYFSGSVVSPLGSELSLIRDDRAALAAIAALGDTVASVHRRTRTTGTLYFGTRGVSQRVEGVDFSDEREFRSRLEINAGSLADLDQPGSLVLPAAAAAKLGVAIGESVIFKTATVTGQQNVGELRLVATTAGGGTLGISSGYTDQATLNGLIGLEPGEFQIINVFLKDVGDSAKALRTAYAALQAAGPVVSRDDTGSLHGRMGSMRAMMGMGGNRSVDSGERWTGTRFAVSGIEDLMAPLLTLVDTLDIISFGIFVLLLAIIMVGMLNSYRMVMIERTAEIGTMRAIGVQRRGIRDIFLVEAVSLTALGAAAGFLAALALMGLASLFNFGSETFFSLFLTQGHLRFFIDPAGTLRNFLILCAMSFAAVYLPARAASRLLPAQALRATY